MKLSLSWFVEVFKSEQKKKLEELQVEEQRLKVELLKDDLKERKEWNDDYVKTLVVTEKPYKNIRLVNTVLTVVMQDGTIYSKIGATESDFKAVKDSISEQEVMKLMVPHQVLDERKKEEIEYKKALELIDKVEFLSELEDFEKKDNSLYLKGINRSIPPLLVNKFYDLHKNNWNEEEYLALKRFFMWCCLNPRAEVVDKLYDFLVRNNMKITKQGFFVGLRNVVRKEEANHDLVDFITNSYQKVRGVWKKKVSEYIVYRKGGEDYYFTKVTDLPNKINDGAEFIGNLEVLYLNLPEMKENRYTDNWTKTFDIRIGKPVTMAPEDCNWSNADCAEAGLHFAGHTSPYVLCGDTSVFTLHNPMKVVGIGSEKGRCWEYLPFMTTTVEEADEIMNSKDFDFLQLDEQYAIDELQNLAEKVKNGFAVEAKKYEFNIPTISSSEIKNIISSLEEMKETLNKRVVNLD